jgi:hypothetical protein
VKKEGTRPLAMKANSVQSPGPHESVGDTPVNAETPGIRTASKEQFEKAQKKTSKLHAGLFRRLAK